MKLVLTKLAAAFIIAVLGLPAIAHAEVVTNWHTDVTIQTTGAVDIQETIVFDPEDNEHHGILRDVPAVLTDQNGQKYYSIIKLTSVTDEQGKAYKLAEQSNNRNGLFLKIGDKDKLIDARPHTYIITYSLTPLVTHTSAGDRLNLNIIGTTWDTPVRSASATIKLPGAQAVSAANCYTGRLGSRQSDCAIAQTGTDTVQANLSSPVGAHEAFTADISFAASGLGQYLEAGKRPPLSSLELAIIAALGISGILLVVGTVIIGRRSWQQWRARRDQTIIPLYEPPAGLTPAHLSVLESPASDVADITATIVHLAVRGILKLEQIRPKTWYRAAGYRIIRLDDKAELAPFEAALINEIFGGQAQIDLDSLRSGHTGLPAAIQKFREHLGNDLTKAGYFVSTPTGSISITRIVLGIIALLGLIIGAVVVYSGDIAAIFPMAVTLICAVIFIWLAAQPTGRTNTGTAEWARVRGFRWFMEVTEKDRLNFTDAPDKTPELFSKMLPYAIALKVEKEWAKQFAGIDVSRAVGGWYGGYVAGSFSAQSFTNSFSSSFGGAMSSGFSGASGAGSAGGGGGGGGGGGW